jgi:L-arabinose isomerase
VVLQEDMQTNQSRQAIRAALNNNWPSVCIVEDLVDDTTTDQEITQVQNALDNFAGTQRIIWMHSGSPATRTHQELQTLTGAEVISSDGSIYLVP